MLEQVFSFQRTDPQVEEKVEANVDTRRLLITHGVLPPDEATQHLKTDADQHVIVVRGVLGLRIADQIIHDYEAGTVLFVPSGVMMEIRSAGLDMLEFFAIKAAHPDVWPLPAAG